MNTGDIVTESNAGKYRNVFVRVECVKEDVILFLSISLSLSVSLLYSTSKRRKQYA